jgi:hypothetical protein
MARVYYERTRKALTIPDVLRTIHTSRNPSKTARIIEWTDTECAGLTLRITKSEASWLIRRRDATIRIGYVRDIDLPVARYVTHQARNAAKRGRDLKVFVKTLVDMRSHAMGESSFRSRAEYHDGWDWKVTDEIADDSSDWGKRRLKGEIYPVWTWHQLTEKFLAEKLSDLKPSYRKRYSRYLTLPEFKPVNDRPMSSIEYSDLEVVRDNILAAYEASTAHRAMRQAREMLTWAWNYHAAKCGLDKLQHAWWERWSVKYKSNVRYHESTISELARTIVVADIYRNLSDNEHATYPGTVGALWAAVLTAQRTGSLLFLRPDRIFPSTGVPKLPGWKVANWSVGEMKGGRGGGRPHALPEVIKLLERYHEESGGKSQWMFSTRKPNDRVTQSALNLLMYRLQGRVSDHRAKNKRDRPGKPGPKPAAHAKDRTDLFKYFGIRPWTLHDIRRTLGSFLDDRRLGGAASAILGHKFALIRGRVLDLAVRGLGGHDGARV